MMMHVIYFRGQPSSLSKGSQIMKALEHKLPPPLVFLVCAALMWLTASQTAALELAAAARIIAAVGFGLVAGIFAGPAIIGFRRAKTTINPVDIEAATALVTGGIYQHSRNPMYVGLTALLLAWAGWLAAPWTLIWPLAFMAFITRFQIIPEERVMAAKFGVSYSIYRENVRRWL
jgi:protein-S-isoprenylcysteine O-methyltransferase Ste14